MDLTSREIKVKEGKRITLAVISGQANQFANQNITFYVLLIPTKELVFRNAGWENVISSPYPDELWDKKLSAKTKAISYLSDNNICFTDTLPNSQDLVSSEINPYKINHGVLMVDPNGRPVAAGYKAISAVWEDCQREY